MAYFCFLGYYVLLFAMTLTHELMVKLWGGTWSHMSKSFIDRRHMRLFRPLTCPTCPLCVLLCPTFPTFKHYVLLLLVKICSLIYLNIKGLTKEPLFLLYTVLLFVCTYKCSLPLGPYVVFLKEDFFNNGFTSAFLNFSGKWESSNDLFIIAVITGSREGRNA